MSVFSLPTPTEVDYFQNGLIDSALEKIKQCINQRIFSFKPEPSWNIYQMESKINQVINQFGWEIGSSWSGSREDGYQVWTIKPI